MRLYILIILLLFMTNRFYGQTEVFTKGVMSEIEYFEKFMQKFMPVTSEHIYIIKIDTSSGHRGSREKLFLMSTIYNNNILDYTDPEYAFMYKENWYLVQSSIEIKDPSPFNLNSYSSRKKEITEYINTNFTGQTAELIYFPYCFFFWTIDGVVTDGIDIGSCDPYFNAGKDHFFYNNEDVKEVEKENSR